MSDLFEDNPRVNGIRSWSIPLPEDLPNFHVDAPTSNQINGTSKQAQNPLPLQDSQHSDAQENEGEDVPRFIGDLNPAARLLDEGETPADQQVTSPDGVGVWVQPQPYGARNSLTSPYPNPSSTPMQPMLERRSTISSMVPNLCVAALSDLYFANIHPILPLLNEEEYRSLLAQNKLPVALMYAVCLIAAKDTAATPYLRLSDTKDSPVAVRTFCTKLHESVMAIIARPSGMRKIILVRILGLLSLHHEGHDGAEQASSQIAQACHHAQSLPLHLSRPNDPNKLEMKRTFWCLWTLDRLNAAISSRPCILHDMDIGVEQPQPGESASPAFDIWFQTAKMLSRAIGLYRPSNPDTVTGIDLEYTSFEQLVEQMQGWQLPPSALATLRIFFLATAILAYRLKTIKELPVTTAARLRQQLSAMQIIRQLQDREHLESLRPLPVVVYGASLALSVSYQQLRYSRLVVDQQEALQDFKTSCTILKMLQQKWSSADAMASLAQKVSVELDRVPNLSVVQVERKGLQKVDVETSNKNPINTGPDAPRNLEEGDPVLDQMYDLPEAEPEEAGFTWDPKVSDLFGGMDDMSWMFLGSETPLNFNSLPYLEMWNGVTE